MKNLNAESGVLSAIINDPERGSIAFDELEPEDFYKSQNQQIFKALLKLYNSNKEIDEIILMEEMGNNGDTNIYISEMSDTVLSAGGISHHIAIIKEKSKLRKINRISYETQQMIKSGSSKEIINKIQKDLNNIDETEKDRAYVNPIDANLRTLKMIETSYHEFKSGKKTILQSDIQDLDDIVELKAGKFIVIKAATSVGKSVLGAQIFFTNIAYRGKIGLFVSAEMLEEELLSREYARQSGIPNWKIQKGKLEEKDLMTINERASMMSEKKFRIFARSASIQDIRSKINDVVREYGKIDFVLIDYVQRMKTEKADTRARELAALSSGYKDLATEYRCVIAALSQVNNEGTARESGDIENDADVVIYLSRPFHEKKKNTKLQQYSMANGTIKYPKEEDSFARIEKNRNGKTGAIDLIFIGDEQRFKSIYGD